MRKSSPKSQFASISLEEFKNALGNIRYAEFPKEFYEADWVEDKNGKWKMSEDMRPITEYCFMIPIVRQDYFIKVYSSIDKEDKVSRGVGEDAIRLVAADEVLKPIRPSFTRINRIGNWRNNLKKRIRIILQNLGNDMTCKNCGGEMVIKKNSEGVNFLGCSNYKEKKCPGRSIVVIV